MNRRDFIKGFVLLATSAIISQVDFQADLISELAKEFPKAELADKFSEAAAKATARAEDDYFLRRDGKPLFTVRFRHLIPPGA